MTHYFIFYLYTHDFYIPKSCGIPLTVANVVYFSHTMLVSHLAVGYLHPKALCSHGLYGSIHILGICL